MYKFFVHYAASEKMNTLIWASCKADWYINIPDNFYCWLQHQTSWKSTQYFQTLKWMNGWTDTASLLCVNLKYLWQVFTKIYF